MEDTSTIDKPFLTYQEQIKKLKIDKGLQIDDEEQAIALLKHYSYFDLISGYKSLFKDKAGNYKIHTSINDIYALYCFDDEIRAIFLKYILMIEKHIKSLISYSFCDENGEEQQLYLNVTKYNYIEKNQDEINDLVSRLKKIIDEPKNYPYVKHQKKKHNNVPLWVMMKALTLGTVSKMYSFLPQKIQFSISKEFDYVHEGMLIQMLDLLSRVRNVCAHSERLYDYRYKKGTIDDTDIHRILNISVKKNNYIKGKNDLFAVVIIFKYLLSENDFQQFVNKLEATIDHLFDQTKCIESKQLLKCMGFPDNWKDIRNCSKTI